MVEEPLIQKKEYGYIYDYIITYDFLPINNNLPETIKDTWICIRIHKSLNLLAFKNIIKNFSTHKYYKDNKYYLYFNCAAKLPYYNPIKNTHEHINLKIYINDKLLKIKPKYANRWYPLSGGVEENETPNDAVKRELFEELGIVSDDIKFINSKKININIPILYRPIKTIMYYYVLRLDKLPKLVINKDEISQIKLDGIIY